MKILFFLFLCIPTVTALAVTPTTITVTEDAGAKLYVYNTLNQTMAFQIEGIYGENFTLTASALKIIEIPPEKRGGNLRIKEIYPEGFVNAIEIPVKVQKKNKESSLGIGSFPLTFASVLALTCISIGVYGWKRKKRKATNI